HPGGRRFRLYPERRHSRHRQRLADRGGLADLLLYWGAERRGFRQCLADQGARCFRGNATMIDAHHHFWWTGRHTYTWPEQVGDRFARDFTPDDLRPELARCGIKGTVLVQV